MSLSTVPFLGLLAFLTMSLAQQPAQTPTQSPPPDLFSSVALPADLISGLTDDPSTDDCWTDELDGSNFVWDKSAEHPFVSYAYRFRNKCARRITCTLIVASGTVLRDKDQKKGSWRPLFADRRSFSVDPGSATEVKGTLKWGATELRMPEIDDSNMPCWFAS